MNVVPLARAMGMIDTHLGGAAFFLPTMYAA
ncbi:MAG: hypothetical protein AVDCRST_MAG43-2046 [uncultured Thermomicrobiales bacterium]|uniref:Uncharacterized protein n=1 Tax=uncultured Thermomicrobiales bacterium TaxID=1645740 RepID=A0A6J4UXB0_9BACT|nr:MAG: hypothetical protein AVDCRST_MAG43-2046 [uncultured Thermomicrobiales bacterium]